MRRALVAGAGPAGIASVGHLLQQGLCVTWVDPSFTAGALASYADVPANTKHSCSVLSTHPSCAVLSSHHSCAVLSSHHSCLSSSQHSCAVLSTHPSCAVLSSHHSCAVLSSQHSCAVLSSQHSCAVLSSQHSCAVLSSQHSCAVLSSQHSCAVDTLWDALRNVIPHGLPSGAPTLAFEEMCANARQLKHNPDPSKLGWTGMAECAAVFRGLTGFLLEQPGVECVRGRVDALHLRDSGQWRASIRRSQVDVDAVVLATGGTHTRAPPSLEPTGWAAAPPAARVLDVDEALQLPKLRRLVGPDEHVAVVGGGHTGVVLCRFLHDELQLPRVRLFVRRPIMLAQWSSASNGYTSWAYRGLKGDSADWALAHGMVGRKPKNGLLQAGGRLELYHVDSLHTSADAGNVDAVAFCLGVSPAALPSLFKVVDNEIQTVEVAGHSHGVLYDANGQTISGLYGVGMAFADDEYTSGEAYPEAGFLPFSLRAAEIAREISLKS
ncbi:hypothetical protein AB1Y20_006206 [Prymnesium parvum]|uniref:FAD/NAD(P)-binding domain-containing protein n=1 Tax=Prymnesium parvum TaxID=97485 RepID=A0AB34J3W9_PRYPA